MSVAADSAAAFDLFRQEVEDLFQVAVVPPSQLRFAGSEVIGRRGNCDGEDEEEPPRNMRRRSSCVDADGHGPSRG